jgi:CheY-like chemotaxis protein
MPGMDGLNFLNDLRKRRDCLGIPVVIMASKEMTPEERQVLELEMDAVLPEADDLEARLRAALASLFPLREREEAE